ncbi:monocarboxylate transporter 10 isoform X2 [Nematostella vectensis]|nr:monocarboxylate transporter 10 isoform X2 [Nematostella vectensis]
MKNLSCSQASNLRPPRRPDSAWSWVVAISGCLSVLVMVGLVNTFAVVMPVIREHYNESRQKIAWIGSISQGLTFFASPLAGVLITRFNFRFTAVVGVMTCATSLIITSFTKSVLQMLLSYSLLFGLGCCFVFMSSVYAVTSYCQRRHAFALGLLSAGQNLGVLSLGPLLQVLMDNLGWRVMYRVLAGVAGIVLLVVLTFDPNVEEGPTPKPGDESIEMTEQTEQTETENTAECNGGFQGGKVETSENSTQSYSDSTSTRADPDCEIPSRADLDCQNNGEEPYEFETDHSNPDSSSDKKSSACDVTDPKNVSAVIDLEKHDSKPERAAPQSPGYWALFCETWLTPAYVIAAVTLTLETGTAFVSYVHLINYCAEVGLQAQESSNLFIVFGVSSLLSSLLSGRILDLPSVNPFHVNQAAALTMALSMLLLQQATRYLHFVVFSVFMGLGIGIFGTTILVLLLNTVDPRLRLISYPIGQMLSSCGNMSGSPLVGFIADVYGSYRPAYYTAGSIMLLAAFIPFLQYCFKPWRNSNENAADDATKDQIREREAQPGENGSPYYITNLAFEAEIGESFENTKL